MDAFWIADFVGGVMRHFENELRTFVIENFLYGRNVTFSNDESFLGMGIIDSTGTLELISFLEREYGIQVEDRDLIPENLDSIALLVQFLNRKLKTSHVSPEIGRQQIAYSQD